MKFKIFNKKQLQFFKVKKKNWEKNEEKIVQREKEQRALAKLIKYVENVLQIVSAIDANAVRLHLWWGCQQFQLFHFYLFCLILVVFFLVYYVLEFELE